MTLSLEELREQYNDEKGWPEDAARIRPIDVSGWTLDRLILFPTYHSQILKITFLGIAPQESRYGSTRFFLETYVSRSMWGDSLILLSPIIADFLRDGIETKLKHELK